MLSPVTADRKSTRLNSSHMSNSYAVFCLKKKNKHKPCRARVAEQVGVREPDLQRIEPELRRYAVHVQFDGERDGRDVEAALFFCSDTATTEIYTLSLHVALPI